MITYYDVLGVDNTATPEEITKSYRKLARTNHPDQGGNAQQFVLIGKAYEVLSTPDSRANYDAEIIHANNNQHNPAPEQQSAPQDSEYTQGYREDSDPVYERDNVRQTAVNWGSYKWFNPEAKYDYKEKIVKPQPHRLRAFSVSSVYWLAGVLGMLALLALLLMVPSMVSFLWGLGAIVLQVFAFKSWSRNFFMGFTPMTVAMQGLVGISLTWIAIVLVKNAHLNGWIIFIIAVLALITNITCIHSMELHNKVLNERLYFAPRTKMTAGKDLLANNTWGSVATFDDSGFSEKNMFLGTVGEEYTDELTNQFFTIPGVKKFNGLRFLGTQNADLDHALVLNDTIIFIDSKQWARGTYKWVNDRSVVATRGQKVSEHRMSFIQNVDQYRKKLPKRCKIYAIVLIHGVGIEIDNSAGMCGGVELMNTQEGIDKIGHILTEASNEAQGKVDYNIMNYLIQNTK